MGRSKKRAVKANERSNHSIVEDVEEADSGTELFLSNANKRLNPSIVEDVEEADSDMENFFAAKAGYEIVEEEKKEEISMEEDDVVVKVEERVDDDDGEDAEDAAAEAEAEAVVCHSESENEKKNDDNDGSDDDDKPEDRGEGEKELNLKNIKRAARRVKSEKGKSKKEKAKKGRDKKEHSTDEQISRNEVNNTARPSREKKPVEKYTESVEEKETNPSTGKRRRGKKNSPWTDELRYLLFSAVLKYGLNFRLLGEIVGRDKSLVQDFVYHAFVRKPTYTGHNFKFLWKLQEMEKRTFVPKWCEFKKYYEKTFPGVVVPLPDDNFEVPQINPDITDEECALIAEKIRAEVGITVTVDSDIAARKERKKSKKSSEPKPTWETKPKPAEVGTRPSSSRRAKRRAEENMWACINTEYIGESAQKEQEQFERTAGPATKKRKLPGDQDQGECKDHEHDNGEREDGDQGQKQPMLEGQEKPIGEKEDAAEEVQDQESVSDNSLREEYASRTIYTLPSLLTEKDSESHSSYGNDPNEYYVEDVSWRYHNPPLPGTINLKGNEVPGAVEPCDLKPLPPAPPLPEFPHTNFCKWTFHEESRVVLANFCQPDGGVVCDSRDIKFLLEMYERDDVTVISEGLVTGLSPEKWSLRYIEGAIGDEYYHKFRRFDKLSDKSTFHKELSKESDSGSISATVKSTKESPPCSPSHTADKLEELDESGSTSSAAKLKEESNAYSPSHSAQKSEALKEANPVCSPSNSIVKSEAQNEASSACTPLHSRNKSEAQVKVESPSTGEGDSIVGVKYREKDIFLAMKVSDYVQYLRLRGKALAKETELGQPPNDCIFTFQNENGVEYSIDVTQTVLYMIDCDLVKLLPALYADFLSCFKLPEILPGGDFCMMNAVNVNGRPFMGPNFYLTPPSSFTHFHQDGHGTVDSGHFCINGYNEVIMLRRMPERHKKHALHLLTGAYSTSENVPNKYAALYNLPHGDNVGEKPDWPRQDAIDRCKKMGYYPSVFILKPGQLVHINKSRLHAFRKFSTHPIPPDDCHAKLRSVLLADNNDLRTKEQLCLSVAWDWMFRGVTAEGINREVVTTLECAVLNRHNGVQSLAIPEHTLIQMARTLAPLCEEISDEKMDTDITACTSAPSAGVYDDELVGAMSKHVGIGKSSSCNKVDIKTTPTAKLFSNADVCRGIYPGLRFIVKQHLEAIRMTKTKVSRSYEKGKKLTIGERPNTWENPLRFALDPYGNSDFFCKLCHSELSNIYLHCDGCENLLCKDFNICIDCYAEKKYRVTYFMHPLNTKRHSTINHLGDPHYDRGSRCPCKNGPACILCGFCSGCSCRCHTWFTLHCRFFNEEDEYKLIQRVESVVNDGDRERAKEVEDRLSSLPMKLPGKKKEVVNNVDADTAVMDMSEVYGDFSSAPVASSAQDKGDLAGNTKVNIGRKPRPPVKGDVVIHDRKRQRWISRPSGLIWLGTFKGGWKKDPLADKVYTNVPKSGKGQEASAKKSEPETEVNDENIDNGSVEHKNDKEDAMESENDDNNELNNTVDNHAGAENSEDNPEKDDSSIDENESKNNSENDTDIEDGAENNTVDSKKRNVVVPRKEWDSEEEDDEDSHDQERAVDSSFEGEPADSINEVVGRCDTFGDSKIKKKIEEKVEICEDENSLL